MIQESCNLGAENYSNEMILRVTLGPFANVYYGPQLIQILLRTKKKMKQLLTKDVNKISNIVTFERKN